MSWTEEKVALLKQLWGEGKTAAEIAKTLGSGMTRNAVIGKAHRLKLSTRLSPIQQNTKKAVKASDQPKFVPVREERPIFRGKGIKLVDLKEKMCRWPSGDPKDADFGFCGCPAVPGIPYCEEHAKVAYQIVSRSRVLRAEDFSDEAGSPDFDIKHAASG